MSIFSIFTLLGGLAFFIYGMNQMSHSLERIAGDKMEPRFLLLWGKILEHALLLSYIP